MESKAPRRRRGLISQRFALKRMGFDSPALRTGEGCNSVFCFAQIPTPLSLRIVYALIMKIIQLIIIAVILAVLFTCGYGIVSWHVYDQGTFLTAETDCMPGLERHIPFLQTLRRRLFGSQCVSW